MARGLSNLRATAHSATLHGPSATPGLAQLEQRLEVAREGLVVLALRAVDLEKHGERVNKTLLDAI